MKKLIQLYRLSKFPTEVQRRSVTTMQNEILNVIEDTYTQDMKLQVAINSLSPSFSQKKLTTEEESIAQHEVFKSAGVFNLTQEAGVISKSNSLASLGISALRGLSR